MRANERGVGAFTYLELMVVITILLIATAIVLPQIRSGTDLNLDSSANRLSNTLRYIYEEAIFKKNTYRIRFDLDLNSYRVERLEKKSEQASGEDSESFIRSRKEASGPKYLPDSNTLVGTTKLLEGVRFDFVQLENRDTIKEGEAFVYAFPDGYIEPVVVQIEAGDHRKVRLTPISMTGTIRFERIAEG